MLNKAVIMGRLVRDPELKYTQSNIPVVSFTVAVDRSFKSENGEKKADFINCVAWRQTAEFVSKYFTKGRMIVVSGSIQTRQYVDQSNNKRTATEVLVDEVSFCGDKPTENAQSGSQSNYNAGGYTNPSSHANAAYSSNYPTLPSDTQERLPAYSDYTGFEDISGEDEDLPF